MLRFIASMAISLLILVFISLKLKVEPEKFYYLIMLLYFLVSATKINNLIPLGFMICLINILSHPTIKNQRAKEGAVILGFFYFIISIFVPIVPK